MKFDMIQGRNLLTNGNNSLETERQPIETQRKCQKNAHIFDNARDKINDRCRQVGAGEGQTEMHGQEGGGKTAL